MDSQEKLISELLNNIRGCNLSDEDGADWNKIIGDYFTSGTNVVDDDSDDETDTEDDKLMDDTDIENNVDGALQDTPQQQPLERFIPFDVTDDPVGLHEGEQIAKEEAMDCVSEHLEVERCKVDKFKCGCINETCHNAFTKDTMLEARLELRVFNEGKLLCAIIFPLRILIKLFLKAGKVSSIYVYGVYMIMGDGRN